LQHSFVLVAGANHGSRMDDEILISESINDAIQIAEIKVEEF